MDNSRKFFLFIVMDKTPLLILLLLSLSACDKNPNCLDKCMDIKDELMRENCESKCINREESFYNKLQRKKDEKHNEFYKPKPGYGLGEQSLGGTTRPQFQ